MSTISDPMIDRWSLLVMLPLGAAPVGSDSWQGLFGGSSPFVGEIYCSWQPLRLLWLHELCSPEIETWLLVVVFKPIIPELCQHAQQRQYSQTLCGGKCHVQKGHLRFLVLQPFSSWRLKTIIIMWAVAKGLHCQPGKIESTLLGRKRLRQQKASEEPQSQWAVTE